MIGVFFSPHEEIFHHEKDRHHFSTRGLPQVLHSSQGVFKITRNKDRVFHQYGMIRYFIIPAYPQVFAS